MPCPYIRTTPYLATGARMHLCENPCRASDAVAPCLAQLRSHCLSDTRFDRCPGYRNAKNQDASLVREPA